MGKKRGQTVPLLYHLEALTAERDLRYEQRFRAQNEAVAYALTAAEKAVVKAEIATEKRFEAVNEFRQSLNDIAALQVSRAEYQASYGSLTEKIAAISKAQDTGTGRSAGTGATWATIAIGTGIILSLAGLALAIIGRLV